MTTTLYLYKETSITSTSSKPVEFPGKGDDWAAIADYKYSATRMSSAPNITATLKWPRCLDNEWSPNVFVNYNEERFFVKNTPSSSYDNTSCLYSHSLELVSERAILDSVYFLNVPTTTSGEGDNSQGDSLSDSTEFSFSGDIHEFVDRLNKSLTKAGVGGQSGYSAVVDKDVTSDTKLFSISNQYVTDVLKSAYELYEVPYYFVKKVIHFGNQQTIIKDPLKYGVENSLLSINKSNSNKQVITRITGTGSDRNIPYYYPNPTPKGTLGLGDNTDNKYFIKNQLAFSSNIDLDKPFRFRTKEDTAITSTGNCDWNWTTVQVNPSIIGKQLYRLEVEGKYNANINRFFVPIVITGITGTVLKWSDYFVRGYWSYAEKDDTRYELTPTSPSSVDLLGYKEGALPEQSGETIKYTIFFIGSDAAKEVSFKNMDYAGFNLSIESITLSEANGIVFSSILSVETDIDAPVHIYLDPTIMVGRIIQSNPLDWFKKGEVFLDGEKVSTAYKQNNSIYLGKLKNGEYEVRNVFSINEPLDIETIEITYEVVDFGFWEYSSTGKDIDFDKSGLAILSGQKMELGDTLTQIVLSRIDVKSTLMPSEYRREGGKNMWYNATNAANRGEWYGDVVFDNVYDSRHPVEYIHTDDEIYPTIKGIKNNNSQRIDTFLDIAFDSFDNNEIYPEDYEDKNLAGKYKHPYFFVKLKKTDGPNGFNLFDHAIEGETMKISFTTGHVAGCEFEIGVDEKTQKNPVQVDEYGDLVRDHDSRDVIVSGDYIETQQNTQTNEVWIALKKDSSTMGVMMPDAINQLVPVGDTQVGEAGGGDKFVILGIHLPETYITEAEDRLEKELIEYLKENNSEKFSFSLKLSSIYLAENESLTNILNENSRVTLTYNNVNYNMYVTSYSLAVKESSALPEVTISINDELKVVKPKIKDAPALIASTENKLKIINSDTAELKAKLLSTASTTRLLESRLVVLETSVGEENVPKLKTQVLAIEENVNSINNRLVLVEKVVPDVGDLKTRVSNVERRVTIAVVTPTENNINN